MISLLSCSKTNSNPSDHRRLYGSLGQHVLLVSLIVVFSSTREVLSANCPLLTNFANDTGILLVNRTNTVPTGSTIHCQWLIVASQYQVSLVPRAYCSD